MTPTKTPSCEDALTRIADRCRVGTTDVSARFEALWVEPAAAIRGSTTVAAVGVLTARVTTRTPADGEFIAVVLGLPPTTPPLDALASGADQRLWWCGWLAGDGPHIPLSITIVCERDRS